LLSTRTGRLYKGLVLGSGAATDVYAARIRGNGPGWFKRREASPAMARTPEEGRAGIIFGTRKAEKDQSRPEELQKVKKRIFRRRIPASDRNTPNY